MTAIKAERLRDLLDYSIVSGRFYWKAPTSYRMKPGDPAGCLNSRGYVLISVDGDDHRAHRLAWLWVTGDDPPEQVDHINRVGSSNGWHNLREATHSTNMMNRAVFKNNKTGFKNVREDRGRFRARVHKDGACHSGPARATAEEASKDAEELRTRFHGTYAI
jgi:hypothetical protein